MKALSSIFNIYVSGCSNERNCKTSSPTTFSPSFKAITFTFSSVEYLPKHSEHAWTDDRWREWNVSRSIHNVCPHDWTTRGYSFELLNCNELVNLMLRLVKNKPNWRKLICKALLQSYRDCCVFSQDIFMWWREYEERARLEQNSTIYSSQN